jgi:hypothetical protein
VLEARSTTEHSIATPVIATSPAVLPLELADATPLADREHELRWLRGTWRQARRGRGRVLFVSGPAGIGKTRLAAALAEHVVASGAALHYGGSGGAGGAKALAAIADARSATAPTLIVLDELHLHERPIAALVEAVDAIETRPVLLVGLFDDDEGRPQLAELVDRVDARGDGRRREQAALFEDVALGLRRL